MTDVRTKRREKVATYAEKEFADHVLTEVAPHQWLCEKPGEGNYHFYVAIVGKVHFVITGDIGSIVWSLYRDAGAFMRSVGVAAGKRLHCNYPMEKVRGGAPKGFIVEAAEELLREEEGKLEDDRCFDPAKVREEWDGETVESWYGACTDAGDEEPDACEDFTLTALTLWHAARCWARLMDAAEAAK